MSNKNILVKRGLLKEDAKSLYETYIKNRTKKLPFVTAKLAVTKNKVIYSKTKKRITKKSSDKITHYLRYKNDSIMISVKTLNMDNPKLNCRLKGYEKFSPKRIILDRNLEIRLDKYIFKSIKKDNTIIFYNSSNKKKINILKKKGVILIKIKTRNNGLFNLREIFKKLYSLGTRNLLIEGGDKITKYLIKERLIDIFYLFQSPLILPNSKFNKYFSSLKILNNKYKKKYQVSSQLGKDRITIYKK